MKRYPIPALLVSLVFFLIHGYGSDINYDSFFSIEEVIEFETEEINSSHEKYESHSNAYLSRGESYLLCEKYELALNDLKKGYEIAQLCSKKEKHLLSLRSLFDQAIAYGNLNLICNVRDCANAMKENLIFLRCKNCRDAELRKEIQTFSSPMFGQQLLFASRSDEILGEDHVSVYECIQRARNTAKLARELIFRANIGVQFALNQIIDELELEAEWCCRSGGIWKACLNPIVTKWSQWERKWKFLRIPPDPAWDD